MSYIIAICFTVISTYFLLRLSKHQKQFPIELIFGIFLAITLSLHYFIITFRDPAKSSFIKETFWGDGLWTTWSCTYLIEIVFIIFGNFYYYYKKRLVTVKSNGSSEIPIENSNNWLDIIFSLSFGIVIVFSLKSAGLLLTFSFLIIPLIISSQIILSKINKFIISLLISILALIFSLLSSYYFDLPFSPTLVLYLVIFYIATIAIIFPLLIQSTPQKVDSIKPSLSKIIFSFEGRLSRYEYWRKVFPILFFYSIIVILIMYAEIKLSGNQGPASQMLRIFGLWPIYAAVIKRLHDRNRSGWWLLIPIINVYFIIEALFFKGTTGDNRFGSDPFQIIDK